MSDLRPERDKDATASLLEFGWIDAVASTFINHSVRAASPNFDGTRSMKRLRNQRVSQNGRMWPAEHFGSNAAGQSSEAGNFDSVVEHCNGNIAPRVCVVSMHDRVEDYFAERIGRNRQSAEFACSSWITDSIGSNLTRSLYFMATESLSVVGALADRDDNGFGLFELHEFRMTGFGVDQCSTLKAAVPRGDDRPIVVWFIDRRGYTETATDCQFD